MVARFQADDAGEINIPENNEKQIRSGQVGLAEVRPAEVRNVEVRTVEVRPAEVRPEEVRPTPFEILVAQVRHCSSIGLRINLLRR